MDVEEKTGFRVIIAGGGVAGLVLGNALEVRSFL
jgi:2-polyprenyl-6-methoxyphenol hydroxylase-like FAD-dependent oxidoreductase